MRKTFVAAALLASLAVPVSAATVLDFTSSGIGTGALTGTAAGTSYTISGSNKLSNATHKNKVGCTGTGWDFACNGSSGGRFDVGFGVTGTNGNEIDGANANKEWVQVSFDSVVKVLGFAGMLAYNDSARGSKGTETVVLKYSADGGSTWGSVFASAIFDDNDNRFNTVGLAYLNNLSIVANVVRFTANGIVPYDDGNANVTAAGLEVAPVPIPASIAFLLAALGALGIAARRKQQRA